MKTRKVSRRRNRYAAALRDPRYGQRIVKSKKKYSRKGRNSSTRQFEDSIQSGMVLG